MTISSDFSPSGSVFITGTFKCQLNLNLIISQSGITEAFEANSLRQDTGIFFSAGKLHISTSWPYATSCLKMCACMCVCVIAGCPGVFLAHMLNKFAL